MLFVSGSNKNHSKIFIFFKMTQIFFIRETFLELKHNKTYKITEDKKLKINNNDNSIIATPIPIPCETFNAKMKQLSKKNEVKSEPLTALNQTQTSPQVPSSNSAFRILLTKEEHLKIWVCN